MEKAFATKGQQEKATKAINPQATHKHKQIL